MCHKVYAIGRNPRRRPEADKEIMKSRSFYMQQHSVVMNEENMLIEEYGEGHWKVKTYRVLHEHWLIILLTLLMVLDILFMVVDLVLSAFYPPCNIIAGSCVCDLTNSRSTNAPHIQLSKVSEDPYSCAKDCIPPPEEVSNTTLALTILSIIILTIFLAELFIHLVVIGCVRFFSSLFTTLDLIIVVVSIGLEIYLLLQELWHSEEDAAVQAATVPLIIFARSWRLLRIGHGAYKEAHDFYGEHIDKLQDRISTLEAELACVESKQPESTVSKPEIQPPNGHKADQDEHFLALQ